MKIDTPFGSYENVFLQVDRYRFDDSIAVQAWSMEEGPIARLTVCLADRTLDLNESYIDTNNCPWALEFIVNNQLGEVTGKSRMSGFCLYPAVKFDIDKLLRVARKMGE